MMNTSHEKLSALIDDELDSRQALRLLEKLGNEQELAQKHQRYQLIGELMKRNQAVITADTFASDIHKRLESEPTYLIRPSSPTRQIQWQNAAMAAAACFLLAVIWLTPANNSMQMNGNVALAHHAQPTERVNAKLNEYLQAHDNAMYNGQTDNTNQRQVRVVRY